MQGKNAATEESETNCSQENIWWKLNEKEYREKFVQEVEAKIRGETKRALRALSTVARETGRTILGRT